MTTAILKEHIRLNAAVFAWETQKTRTTFDNFYTVYQKSLEYLANDAAPDSQQVDSFLQTALACVPKFYDASRKFGLLTAMTVWTPYMDLLVEEANIAYIKSLENGDEALAWIVTMLSGGYTETAYVEDKKILEKALSLWAGFEADPDFEPNLNEVIDILYGPSCRTLYGIDVSKGSSWYKSIKIVAELNSAGLPLQFKNMNNAADNQILPDLLAT